MEDEDSVKGPRGNRMSTSDSLLQKMNVSPEIGSSDTATVNKSQAMFMKEYISKNPKPERHDSTKFKSHKCTVYKDLATHESPSNVIHKPLRLLECTDNCYVTDVKKISKRCPEDAEPKIATSNKTKTVIIHASGIKPPSIAITTDKSCQVESFSNVSKQTEEEIHAKRDEESLETMRERIASYISYSGSSESSSSDCETSDLNHQEQNSFQINKTIQRKDPSCHTLIKENGVNSKSSCSRGLKPVDNTIANHDSTGIEESFIDEKFRKFSMRWNVMAKHADHDINTGTPAEGLCNDAITNNAYTTSPKQCSLRCSSKASSIILGGKLQAGTNYDNMCANDDDDDNCKSQNETRNLSINDYDNRCLDDKRTTSRQHDSSGDDSIHCAKPARDNTLGLPDKCSKGKYDEGTIGKSKAKYPHDTKEKDGNWAKRSDCSRILFSMEKVSEDRKKNDTEKKNDLTREKSPQGRSQRLENANSNRTLRSTNFGQTLERPLRNRDSRDRSRSPRYRNSEDNSHGKCDTSLRTTSPMRKYSKNTTSVHHSMHNSEERRSDESHSNTKSSSGRETINSRKKDRFESQVAPETTSHKSTVRKGLKYQNHNNSNVVNKQTVERITKNVWSENNNSKTFHSTKEPVNKEEMENDDEMKNNSRHHNSRQSVCLEKDRRQSRQSRESTSLEREPSYANGEQRRRDSTSREKELRYSRRFRAPVSGRRMQRERFGRGRLTSFESWIDNIVVKIADPPRGPIRKRPTFADRGVFKRRKAVSSSKRNDRISTEPSKLEDRSENDADGSNKRKRRWTYRDYIKQSDGSLRRKRMLSDDEEHSSWKGSYDEEGTMPYQGYADSQVQSLLKQLCGDYVTKLYSREADLEDGSSRTSHNAPQSEQDLQSHRAWYMTSSEWINHGVQASTDDGRPASDPTTCENSSTESLSPVWHTIPLYTSTERRDIEPDGTNYLNPNIHKCQGSVNNNNTDKSTLGGGDTQQLNEQTTKSDSTAVDKMAGNTMMELEDGRCVDKTKANNFDSIHPTKINSKDEQTLKEDSSSYMSTKFQAFTLKNNKTGRMYDKAKTDAVFFQLESSHRNDQTELDKPLSLNEFNADNKIEQTFHEGLLTETFMDQTLSDNTDILESHDTELKTNRTAADDMLDIEGTSIPSSSSDRYRVSSEIYASCDVPLAVSDVWNLSTSCENNASLTGQKLTRNDLLVMVTPSSYWYEKDSLHKRREASKDSKTYSQQSIYIPTSFSQSRPTNVLSTSVCFHFDTSNFALPPHALESSDVDMDKNDLHLDDTTPQSVVNLSKSDCGIDKDAKRQLNFNEITIKTLVSADSKLEAGKSLIEIAVTDQETIEEVRVTPRNQDIFVSSSSKADIGCENVTGHNMDKISSSDPGNDKPSVSKTMESLSCSETNLNPVVLRLSDDKPFVNENISHEKIYNNGKEDQHNGVLNGSLQEIKLICPLAKKDEANVNSEKDSSSGSSSGSNLLQKEIGEKAKSSISNATDSKVGEEMWELALMSTSSDTPDDRDNKNLGKKPAKSHAKSGDLDVAVVKPSRRPNTSSNQKSETFVYQNENGVVMGNETTIGKTIGTQGLPTSDQSKMPVVYEQNNLFVSQTEKMDKVAHSKNPSNLVKRFPSSQSQSAGSVPYTNDHLHNAERTSKEMKHNSFDGSNKDLSIAVLNNAVNIEFPPGQAIMNLQNTWNDPPLHASQHSPLDIFPGPQHQPLHYGYTFQSAYQQQPTECYTVQSLISNQMQEVQHHMINTELSSLSTPNTKVMPPSPQEMFPGQQGNTNSLQSRQYFTNEPLPLNGHLPNQQPTIITNQQFQSFNDSLQGSLFGAQNRSHSTMPPPSSASVSINRGHVPYSRNHLGAPLNFCNEADKKLLSTQEPLLCFQSPPLQQHSQQQQQQCSQLQQPQSSQQQQGLQQQQQPQHRPTLNGLPQLDNWHEMFLHTTQNQADLSHIPWGQHAFDHNNQVNFSMLPGPQHTQTRTQLPQSVLNPTWY